MLGVHGDIRAAGERIYDQLSDRKEEHNLSTTSVALVSTLSSQLKTFRQNTSTTKDAPKVTVDPELQEKLSALGYTSDSSSSPMPGVKETGADPKDKVEVVNLLHEAEMLKEEMRFKEAVPPLERVIVLEPNLPIAYLQLGTALSSLRDYEKALPVLRKAVEMRPDLIIPRYQLGSALFETGEFAASAIEFETAVSRSPDWPEAHFSLATAYARMDRMPDAIKEYQKVIDLRPNHYGAHLLLGRALTIFGDPTAALPKLTKASSLQPNSPEPHSFLADAYEQLGQTADAERERAEAERLKTSRKP